MAYAKKKSPRFWCNSFFSLNVPERIRRGFDWSVAYSIKCILRFYGLSYRKNKLMLSQIHFNGGSSIAGLGKSRGGGFVFLKHYHRQCICWLDYVASYPSQPCNFSISVFPFWFCLNFFLSFLFVDCFGYLTLYNCIHVYTAGGDMTLVPS